MRLYEFNPKTADSFTLRQPTTKSDNPNSTVDDSPHIEDYKEEEDKE